MTHLQERNAARFAAVRRYLRLNPEARPSEVTRATGVSGQVVGRIAKEDGHVWIAPVLLRDRSRR